MKKVITVYSHCQKFCRMTVMKIKQPATKLKIDQLESAMAQIVARILSFIYMTPILSQHKYILFYCTIMTYMSKYEMTKVSICRMARGGGVAFACFTPNEGLL